MSSTNQPPLQAGGSASGVTSHGHSRAATPGVPTAAQTNFAQSSLANLVRVTLATLKQVEFPLVMPGSDELTSMRTELVTHLEARLLPHLESQALPMVVVLGGSSGAGKSTIVNTLVRKAVTQASILRPTTRVPTVVIHPLDERAMAKHNLARYSNYLGDDAGLPGVVVVDAPDLDTVETDNHEISQRLLDSADLWVFVTTASRYGDAVAWQTLQRAFERGTTCAVILNRVPQKAKDKVFRDLRQRMYDAGMTDVPLFVMDDVGPCEQLLPPAQTAEFKEWLTAVSRSRMASRLVDKTTAATLPALREDLALLADGLETQSHAVIDLRDKAALASVAPLDKLTRNIESGRFGQGAPTTAWLALASAGAPLSGLVSGKKPGLFSRDPRSRDNAATALFDSVLAGTRLALRQGVVRVQEGIEAAWSEDVVDTARLRKRARLRVDVEAIVDSGLEQWRLALRGLGAAAKANPWLSSTGNAALIGAAAGGISGVVTAAQKLGLEQDVRQARSVLAAAARNCVEQVVDAYCGTLDDIAIADPTVLRLRATEFRDRAAL